MLQLAHITTTQTSLIRFPSAVPRQHAQRSRLPLVRRIALPLRAKNFPSLRVANKSDGDEKGMSWFYEVEEEVREYELDQFGVVNNAVYSNYGEYATYKLLDSIGFDADIKLALAQALINYISPLKRKDRFIIKVRICDYSTTRFYVEHQIVKLPNHEIIIRGTATLVLIDERLRPSRITPSMISKFNKFLLTPNNDNNNVV